MLSLFFLSVNSCRLVVVTTRSRWLTGFYPTSEILPDARDICSSLLDVSVLDFPFYRLDMSGVVL
jgi:hypothetical protein